MNEPRIGAYKCEITDTLYVYNTSYGAAEGFVFSVGGNKPYTIKTTSKEEVIKLPPFDLSELESDNDFWNGKQIPISLLQKHPGKDTIYNDMLQIHQPTVAAFEVERINHFNREMPDDYYLINETEVVAHNQRLGSELKERWLVNGELKDSGPHKSDFSFLPGQPGFYELKLVISNDFSADTAIALFDFHLTTAVEELSTTEIQVYPTLCHTSINIQNSMEEMYLEVYDISGKIVREQNLFTGQKTLDVSSLTTGIYLLNFQSQQRQKTIKIVKQ